MTPKQRERLNEELYKNNFSNKEIKEISHIVEKVLKEGECQACKDGIPKTWPVRHACHTPSSAKVELPEKIDEVLTLNYLTLKNKLNEVIDYLSAKEKEHGN